MILSIRQNSSSATYCFRPNSSPRFKSPLVGPKGFSLWFGQLLSGIDHLDGPLLKLDRITPGKVCGRDEFAGDIQIAVMVDADLGHDEARLPVADQMVSNFHFVVIILLDLPRKDAEKLSAYQTVLLSAFCFLLNQDGIADFADSAVTAGLGGNPLGDGQHFGLGVGDGNGHADPAHAIQIVHIIPNVSDLFPFQLSAFCFLL